MRLREATAILLIVLACVVGWGWPELGHAQPFVFTQLTNTTGGSTLFPATNAAGTRIAFESDRDVTPGSPGNADGNTEIFLFDTTTSTFTQLTNTPPQAGFANIGPSINAAGTRVAFLTDANPAGANPDGNREIALDGARPSPTDYDGDGQSDVAVWRPSSGTWFIRPSGAPGTFTTQQWGLPTDLPVPGDYDQDGRTDIAVWRPSRGLWFIRRSSDGGVTTELWGLPTDVPLASVPPEP